MNYFAIVSFMNGIFAMMTALYVFYKYRSNPIYRSFYYFASSVSIWAIFYGLWQFQNEKALALIFIRAAQASITYAPFAFFWFVVQLSELNFNLKWTYWLFGVPTFFSLACLTPLMIKDVERRMFFEFWPIPGPFMHLYLALFTFFLLWSFVILIQSLKVFVGIKKWQLQWILATSLVGWAGGYTNWFLWYDIPLPPVPNLFVAVFFLLIVYAITRRGLFDVETLGSIVFETRLSILGAISASINHEIKNPLFIMKSSCETLLEQFNGVPICDSDQEIIRKTRLHLHSNINQINRVLEITNIFGSFVSRAPFQNVVEKTNLKELIVNVVTICKYQLIHKDLIIYENAQSLDLHVNRKELEEVIMNILLNAFEASPNKGIVEIFTEETLSDVAINIRDSGPGIQSSMIRKIYEPFYTTKTERGHGLGLFIVKKLTDKNKWDLNVSSKDGCGAHFILKIDKHFSEAKR